ncbi:S-formylglutathione hydrolase [Motiliproteus sediminis]|uniref:S-formylglutathione hydrolase n=1 Tax=Motiliproteus sediminis TaxID=1468178 RepID=UPI0024847969|nr:S-formylglutathione hydrolase [Motiliproteus sediminis]
MVASAPLEVIEQVKVFAGQLTRYRHHSHAVNGDMELAVFLPPQAHQRPVPALYWLSGLTCTDQNFCQKAGAFGVAAELGLALICPDTSPRGCNLPGEEDDWDFGSGAGFYLNATQPPWSRHYRMYDYVVDELPELLEHQLPLSPRRSLAGHSMGGHGALVCGLRNPERYSSLSAFAPISNPSNCPWGQKAFGHYLGPDREQWRAWDACELLRQFSAPVLPLLVDQGEADPFLTEQLQPQQLEAACRASGYPLTLRYQAGYDHSYYFIASFISDHLRFHAIHLGLVQTV